jgi:hypothetical protein
MKAVLIIFVLILLVLLSVYLLSGFIWRKIDVISSDTAEYIRKRGNPDFDIDIFRKQMRILLQEQQFLKDNRVIFHTPFYSRFKNQSSLNAHTGFPGHNILFFNPEWASRLYPEFCQSEDCSGRGTMTDFFVFALGHEMTHKEAQYKPLFLFGKKRVACDWVREIFADFGGIRKSKMPPVRVITAIKTEIPVKYRKLSKKNVGSKLRHHPSWEYRIMCMENGFDVNDVVDRVCGDCGVDDVKFRERMKRKFS